ncbi:MULTISPECIES: hypothetical protein [Streptomyces]|uniref:hypothetical protein n=1 Tax=Streptomyces TaxID=1883 RepID=UPI0036B1B560
MTDRTAVPAVGELDGGRFRGAGGGHVVAAVGEDRQQRFGCVAHGARRRPGRAGASSVCIVPSGCARSVALGQPSA